MLKFTEVNGPNGGGYFLDFIQAQGLEFRTAAVSPFRFFLNNRDFFHVHFITNITIYFTTIGKNFRFITHT